MRVGSRVLISAEAAATGVANAKTPALRRPPQNGDGYHGATRARTPLPEQGIRWRVLLYSDEE